MINQYNFLPQVQAVSAPTDAEEDAQERKRRRAVALPIWGNVASINLNHMIVANVQGSPYFRNKLFGIKVFNEVVDEIYYKVSHLEPWEKGSRKTAGQTGMCGGVRGVSAGGIVSSCFCLLYKLGTLRLSNDELYTLLNHRDSPFIRGIGFLYVRYTQAPAELWDWFFDYLEDPEEIDVKAGGGHLMTIGEMVYQMLTKLDWYGTMFPRIPVPIEKKLHEQLKEWRASKRIHQNQQQVESIPDNNDMMMVGGQPVALAATEQQQEPLPPPQHQQQEQRDARADNGDDSKTKPSSRRRDHHRSRSRDRDNNRHRRNSRDKERKRSRSKSRDRHSHGRHSDSSSSRKRSRSPSRRHHHHQGHHHHRR